jgi:hypothetical protein
MKDIITGKMVTLQTYGLQSGTVTAVDLPIEWVEKHSGLPIAEFLDDYTYDESEWLERKYRDEVYNFYNPLIEEALSNYDEDDDENNHLQYTWLEESGDRKEEWVLNVGTIIIEDGLTRQQAEHVYYILL